MAPVGLNRGSGRQSGGIARAEGALGGAVEAQPAIARGPDPGRGRWLFVRGGGSAVRLLGRHLEGTRLARAKTSVGTDALKYR